jgi:5'-3' exonuclease
VGLVIALIDGDVLVYRVGFASDNQTEVQNCINCDLVVKDILSAVGATDYKMFLSDSLENNFRYAIDNNYKANRKDARRPRWYDSLKLFLKQEYKAEVAYGQEADDALGIGQSNLGVSSIICSIDKDLLQVPGEHYNLAKGIRTTVTPTDGIRSFYKQLLTGDTVDNIKGVDGIGPVKSGRHLDSLTDERDMFETVRGLYLDDPRLLRNGQLLWVRRKENELWRFPTGCGIQGLQGSGE